MVFVIWRRPMILALAVRRRTLVRMVMMVVVVTGLLIPVGMLVAVVRITLVWVAIAITVIRMIGWMIVTIFIGFGAAWARSQHEQGYERECGS